MNNKKQKNKKIKKTEKEQKMVGEIVKISDMKDDDFFDDCPVCQAMKFARDNGHSPTLTELRESFQKAKDKGAIVGGEWFDKDKNKESKN